MTGNEARAAYSREWRRNNPDRVREQQRRYWDKKAGRQTAGPLDSVRRCIDGEIEKRRKGLAGADPDVRSRLEGEIRNLEEIRQHLDTAVIETRKGGETDAD